MKKIMSIVLALVMLIMIVPSTVHATGAAEQEYILVFSNLSIPQGTAARIERIGGRVVRELPQIGVIVASGGDNFARRAGSITGVMTVGPSLMLSLDLPDVQMAQDVLVEEDYTPTAQDIADNTLYMAYQWDIMRVGGDATTWAVEKGAGAVVAVLDTGVYAAHPDIAPNYLYGKDFTDITVPLPPGWIMWDLGGMQDYNGHGTHVAGTIAGAITAGRIIGVAPEASIANYKVMVAVITDTRQATGIGYTSWIIGGIVEAADDGVNVINMSLGGWAAMNTRDGAASFIAYSRATQYARSKGTLVIASAGNSGLNLDQIRPVFHVPSGTPHTLSISATGLDDSLAFYSNYGWREIFMTAPGGDVSSPPFSYCLSAYSPLNAWAPGAGWVWSIGTSMSAPKVAGVAALIYARNPSFSAGMVEAMLLMTAENMGRINRAYFGHGMADAYHAVIR